jgi:Lrp/AsnC family leucine-responsive transcriptional regulator
MRIDAIDKKILEIMQSDGRITNSKLASLIGISPPATLERVRNLEASGVISKYAALVDREKIGLGVMAIVSVSLVVHEQTSVDKIKERLLELDEVLECHMVSGEDDFVLKVVLESIHGYSDFAMQKLASIPGIQNFKSSFVLNTIKNSTCFPIKFNDL